MASSLQQPPFLISLKSPNQNCSPYIRTFQCKILKPFPFRALKATSSSSDPTRLESSSTTDSAENQADSKSDRVKLAFDKAREYKKKLSESKISSGSGESKKSWNGGTIPKGGPRKDEKVSEAAMKTTEYEKNNGVMLGGGGSSTTAGDDSPGNHDKAKEIPETLRMSTEKAKEDRKGKEQAGGGEATETSIKRPGSETRNGSNRSIGNLKDIVREKIEPRFTDLDFIGLDFFEKKDRRGLPPGLLPVDDPYASGEMPEVEIIVGDSSKFGKTQSTGPKKPLEETPDLYKPQVSTWGVFPRPSNISKTYGGGRNLRPGEPLETPEVKAAREARTREMLAKYRASIGLYIDPKIQAECEKACKEGDALMDVGKLEEALPYYQKVMDKMAFQTELHGLAALQWSICQDSLRRSEAAQAMYKRLQSHPNASVSKRAKHFVFSFEAMEFMKLKGTAPVDPGYKPYLEAFVEEKTTYKKEIAEEEEDEGALFQALPYLVFLASPFFLVLYMAVNKRVQM